MADWQDGSDLVAKQGSGGSKPVGHFDSGWVELYFSRRVHCTIRPSFAVGRMTERQYRKIRSAGRPFDKSRTPRVLINRSLAKLAMRETCLLTTFCVLSRRPVKSREVHDATLVRPFLQPIHAAWVLLPVEPWVSQSPCYF